MNVFDFGHLTPINASRRGCVVVKRLFLWSNHPALRAPLLIQGGEFAFIAIHSQLPRLRLF